MAQFPVSNLSALPIDQEPIPRQILEGQQRAMEQDLEVNGLNEERLFSESQQPLASPPVRNISQQTTPAEGEDAGASYAAMAQAREADVNIDDFRERIRRRKEQANPTPTPQTTAPSPDGGEAPIAFPATTTPQAEFPDPSKPAATKLTVTPWYAQPTVAEIAAQAWKNVKESTPKEREAAVGAVVSDVFKGTFVESVPAIGKGINVGAKELVTTIADIADWLDSKTGIDPTVKEITENELIDKLIQKPVRAAADILPGGEGIKDPTTITGTLLQEAARFIVGFVPAVRAIKTVGTVVGGVTKRAAQSPIFQSVFGGAAAEMLTRPPADPNISNLIQLMPALANPVNEFLASDPSDSRALNKFRAGVEGLGFGILAEGIVLGVRALASKGRVVPEVEAQRRIYGDVPKGEVLGAGEAINPPITTDKPLTIDISAPNAEAKLRETIAVPAEARPVFEDAFRQLIDAGLPEQEARAHAALFANRYANKAERFGGTKTPLEFYNERNIRIERTDDTSFDFNRIADDAKIYAGVTLPKTPRQLVDDHIGTGVEKQQAVDAVNSVRSGQLTIEQFNELPIIKRAQQKNANSETGLRPDDITPERRATAVFDFDGEQVIGYEEAIKRLKTKAQDYAGGPVQTDRNAVILIGPPAAGKSTIANDLAISRGAAIPDADDIKHVMPEMKTKGSGYVHEESSVINSEVVGKLVEDGTNLVLPKIGGTSDNIRNLAKSLQDNGYTVDLVNMVVAPGENYLRMVSRYIETGRWVDADYLRSIGDKPLNTYNLLKGEGTLNGSTASFDNNGRVLRLIDGSDTFEAEINTARARRSGNRPDDRRDPSIRDQGKTDQPGNQAGADQFAQQAIASGKIRAAAVEIDGKIYEGTTHFDAIENARDKIKLPENAGPEDLYDMISKEGFVTKEGKFVDRVEAGRLVTSMEDGRKLPEGMYLISENLEMNSGQFAQLDQTPVRDYKRVVKDEPVDPNYVYYPTNLQTAEWIANNGRVPTRRPFELEGTDTWMDGAGEPRAYFSTSTSVSSIDNGKPVLLRVSRSKHPLSVEQGSQDVYSRNPVPTSAVEFLDANGTWRPIGSGRPREFAQQTKDQIAKQEVEQFLQTEKLPMDAAARMKRAEEQGYTIEAYHGTNADFDSFKRGTDPENSNKEDLGIHFGTPGQAENRIRGYESTPAKEIISDARILPARLKLKKPLRLEDATDWTDPTAVYEVMEISGKFTSKELESNVFGKDISEIREFLKSKGYDGVVYKNQHEFSAKGGGAEDSYLVFDPNQIRSPFAAFDPANADSGFLLAQRAPAFYSSVEQAINSAKQDKAPGTQWLNTLKNTPGVKPEELSWTGLDKWLSEQGRKQVTKDDVNKFFQENKVEVQEVAKKSSGMESVDFHSYQNEAADQIRSERPSIDEESDLFMELVTNRQRELVEQARVPTREQVERIVSERHPNLSRDTSEYEAAIAVEEERLIAERGQAIEEDRLPVGEPNYSPETHPTLSVPGGENYRELLLTLPDRSSLIDNSLWKAELNHGTWTVTDENGKIISSIAKFNAKDESAAINYVTKLKSARSKNADQNYTGGHFDEPNVLAHVRMDDRVINGKRTLFIEEIQSDWHQAGRKRGYKGEGEKALQVPDDIKQIAEKINSAAQDIINLNDLTQPASVRRMNKLIEKGVLTIDEVTRMNSWQTQNIVQRASNQVPDAPFKKTWHELALKRMIRQAADEGYDQIAWTSGKIQNERYDLSKQLNGIFAQRNVDGTFNVSGIDLNNRDVPIASTIPPDKLADHIGKELAEKIVAQRNGMVKYEGLDLQVGGTGMVGFYDKMLVKAANDIGKPFGAKTKLANIISDRPKSQWWPVKQKDGTWKLYDGYPDEYQLEIGKFNSKNDLDDYVEKNSAATTGAQIHTLELTPRLKATAQEQGFKLFQEPDAPPGWRNAETGPEQAAATPKGLISFKDNETVITLFRTADASTFTHETGHLWLDEMFRDAALPDAPTQIKADAEKILQWFKIENSDQVSRSHHEQWARGWEQYMASGKAPSPGLEGAFQRFKDWLIDIYKSLRNMGDEQISDEIRGVMDRIVGTDADIAMAGKKAFDTQGFTPEGLAYYGPRLRALGYDSVVFEGAQLIGEQGGRAVSIVPRRSAVDVVAPELGVPTSVVAQGISRSAEDFANQVGVARVIRADADPVHRGGSDQEVFINFGRINAPDDIKQTIRDLADADRGKIDEARRGVITHEQTQRMAEDLGMTVDDLLNRRAGSPMNAEEMLAARNLLSTSGKQVLESSKRAGIPNATLSDQYNFMKLVGIHTAIQREVIAARTEVARSLSAMRIMSTDSNVAMAREIQNILDAHGGDGNVARLAQTLQDLSAAGVPVAAMNMAVKKGWLATTSDGLKEIFTAGLLWLPPTHAVNIASNLVTAGAQIYERGAAKVMADLMGAPVGARVVDGEALAMTFGMLTSFKEAFRLAGAAIKENPVHSQMGSKFADKELGAIGSHVWSRERGHSMAEAQAFAESPMGRFVDFLGNTFRLPYRALGAEDEFAKAITWRAEASAQAMRQAVEEGLEGQAKWNRIIDLVNNPPETVSLAAADAATYTTFQSKLGTIGQGLMTLRSGPLSLPVTMVLPFVKTPTNIFRYAFERMPIAPLVAQWREDVASGGARQQIALARMATGTAIMAVAFDMAGNGQITGAGPRDPSRRETLLRLKWEPNSIVNGEGKYFSYNRADPYAMIFSFAATTTELMKRSDLSPEDYDQISEVIAAGIGIISASIVDKTYFQGVAQAFAAINSSERGAQGVTNFINRQAGALLPASSAFSMVKRFKDPVTREFTDPWESVMSKIAGLSERLSAARSLWGDELKPQEVYGRAWDVLSPIRVSQELNSPIDKELVRLNAGVSKINKKGSFDGADVNFYDFPKVYERYAVLAGNELIHPVYGMGAKDFLNSVVQGSNQWSEIYKMMPDNKEGKGAWIKNRISEYRALAQQQIMREEADQWPEFVAWVEARKQQQMELKLPESMKNQLQLPSMR